MRKADLKMVSLIVAILILIMPASAMADLERGDRGDDVVVLQQLLFENGWLFELPDGIFGGNTESAVREFEEYAGLPIDGIADEEMVYELAVAVKELNDSNGVVSSFFGSDPVEYIFGETYGESGEDGGGTEFAVCCSQWTAVDGNVQTDYCEEHHTLHIETYRMLESGDAGQARHASELWHAEVNRLYEQWAEFLSEEERGGVLANRATFLASVEAQRAAGNMFNSSDETTIKTEVGIVRNLRNQSVWLCEVIWQEKVSAWSEADGENGMVRIDGLTIIEGDNLYYSGMLADEDDAVEDDAIYVMNLDGSGCRKLADVNATLEAVSNGNLLIWAFDDKGYGSLKILRTDGTLEDVAYDYNGHAIAENGRFYYGGSSVAEDGSDHQWLLSSDPQYHEQYWPLDVVDGYLYYKDYTGGENVGYWGGYIPEQATLNRLNLATGDIELLSGPGTILFGIENNTAFYTVRDFSMVDDEGNFFWAEVEKGVYAMDLTTLEARLIDEEMSSWEINEHYEILEDGILYGIRSDENGDYSFIRVMYDGTELPLVSYGDHSILILDVTGSVLYGHATVWTDDEDEDAYLSEEYFFTYDFSDDEWETVKLDTDETIYYVDGGPSIRIVGDRVYFYVMDTTDGKVCLKSVRISEGDVQTILTTGYDYY